MVSKAYQNPFIKPSKAKKKRRSKELQRIARGYALELTEKATEAEKAFAEILSARGIRFEFQHPFQRGESFAIVDFWLPDYGVIVEIDGGYHNTHEQKLKDAERSAFLLKKEKIRKVVRFSNEQAIGDEDAILKELARHIVPWAAKHIK